jgi:23S rRNA (pseudouridine1915-N3)-methyltransferase
MLSVNVVCIGKLKESYLKDAVAEYSKRLSPFCKFSVIELDEYRLPDNPSQAQIDLALKDEGERILKKVEGSAVVALCVEGKQMPSEEFSKFISNTSLNTSSISFVIGGSFGLSNEVKAAAKLKLSFSKMTFPHQLMRVILCEQIYRAFMIEKGTKYHK